MTKASSSLESAPFLGSKLGNSRVPGDGFARGSISTLLAGILRGIAIRYRVWRRKLSRLLGRSALGVEHRRRQSTPAKLSDHALRDIGLTRMDLDVEPGESKPVDPADGT